MATTVAELQAVITADTRDLDSGLAKVNQGFGGLGVASLSASNIISGAIGGLVAGAFPALVSAITEVGKSIYEVGATFDAASDQIRISTGAVGAELAVLETSFKTVFTSIPASAEDASKAISFLSARLHLSGEALEDLAKTELELARITGSALAPQLEATTRVFKDWEIATNQQTASLDLLFKVGQKTAIGVTDLSQRLVQFGAPLRQLGFSFEEAAILIGKFQAEGVDLGKALPGLRIALSEMAESGVKNAAEAFKQLIERIQSAKTPMDATREAIEIFGRRAGPDMAEAIKQGRFSIEELQKAIADSKETIVGVGKDTEDFAEKWVLLKNKATEALEPLGAIVFDALTAVASSFTDTSDEITKRWSKLWEDLGITTEDAADNQVVTINSMSNKILDILYDTGRGFEALGQQIIDFSILGKHWLNLLPSPADVQVKLKLPGDQVSRHDWKKILDLDGQKRVMDEILGYTDQTMEKLGNSTRRGGRAAGKAFIEEIDKELLERLKQSAKAIEFIFKEVNEGMEALARSLKLPVPPLIEFVDGFKDAAEAIKKLQDAAKDLIPAEKELEGVMESAGRVIADTEPYVRAQGAAEALKNKTRETTRAIAGYWNDINNVVSALPGKWGQSLNRTLDEVNRWVSFLDAAIKLVQRIMGDEQTGLGGIISKIGGIFKETTVEIQDASQDWSGALEQMSTGVSTQMNKAATGTESGASRIVGAFTQIAGAALAFIGAKGQGFVGGAVSGALGGIAAAGGIATALGVALSPLTLGLSALGGALIGGLLGLFGGKSAEQKAAEARQIEQAKLSLQQTAQNVINAAIQGFDSALKFFENLEQFTAPRKAKFAEFWKAMKRLMDGFVDLAKVWGNTSLKQAEEVAKSIGPIAETISKLPEAFNAISGHFGIAQSSIDRFFDDFSKIMDSFFERSEIWIDGISKRAMKVANRLSPVVALISAFGQALTDISGAKEPGDEIFAMFSRVLDKIVDAVANLSLKFDKAVLKTMANFAEKAGAALAIWKDAIESIKATVDIQAPSEASVDNVVAGIELFINKLAGAVERLIGTDLARITAFANVIQPIAAAIKAWAETAEIIRGYTAVAAEVWDQIVTDFERGLVLLNLLILDAQLYVDKATIFKSLIDQGAGLIEAALAAFGSSISSAASALTGGLPQGGSPMSAQSFAASSVGASAATSAASQQTVVNVTVNGSVFTGEQITEAVMQGLERGRRQGRVAPSVFTGTPALVR